MAAHASVVGRTIGTASRIGKDYREKKDRLWTMNQTDRLGAIAWGEELLVAARATGVRSAGLVAGSLATTFADAKAAFEAES